MTQEEKILQLFEEYFATASKEELEEEVRFINQLGDTGITFEDYLETLNQATAYSLVETGLCDDIAYADLFNRSISPVQMDNQRGVTVVENFVRIALASLYSKEVIATAGESNYAMAA